MRSVKPSTIKQIRKQFSYMKRRLKRLLIERDGRKCALCGQTREITIDHIEPIIRGGNNDLDNLQLLCMPCNTKKGHK